MIVLRNEGGAAPESSIPVCDTCGVQCTHKRHMSAKSKVNRPYAWVCVACRAKEIRAARGWVAMAFWLYRQDQGGEP